MKRILGVVLAGLLITAAPACKTVQTQPGDVQTPESQTAKLAEMAKAAESADMAMSIARAAQDTEIEVFRSGTVQGFSDEQHVKNQEAFKKFFEISEKAMVVARDVSKADADRRSAVARIGEEAKALVARIETKSPLLNASLSALLSAALALNLIA